MSSTEIEAPGPMGPLKGMFLVPESRSNAPVVLIIPGSGPTDRDGNSPFGLKTNSYRLLAEALAERGIASVRIDKRGMFGSAGAVRDPNAVSMDDYVADTRQWIATIRVKTGASCVWLLGHSEGGLVALASAVEPLDVCGVVAVSAPGRPLGLILREQLRANPANAPILPQIETAIASLEKGERVETGTLHPGLRSLFRPAVQNFWIEVFRIDPAVLAGRMTKPLLIVQGDNDIQIGVEDARRLKAAARAADLAILPGVNHALKSVPPNDRAANLATYGNPDLPLAPSVAPVIADFIRKPR